MHWFLQFKKLANFQFRKLYRWIKFLKNPLDQFRKLSYKNLQFKKLLNIFECSNNFEKWKN